MEKQMTTPQCQQSALTHHKNYYHRMHSRHLVNKLDICLCVKTS